jgi:hypothetical protein
MTPSRPLRVLQLAVTDHGGAGMACIRLHRAFLSLNVDSRVLVRRLYRSDEGITQAGSRWNAALRFRLDRLPLYLYPRKNVFGWWSVNWLPDTPRTEFGDWQPDIVHAHWIGTVTSQSNGLLRPGGPSSGQCMICGPSREVATMRRIACGMRQGAVNARNSVPPASAI